MWYLFRLLCSHLKEGGNALNTLLNSVVTSRLKDLLSGRADAEAALGRLRSAFGKDAFITKVRDSIGSYYQQADIKGVYERDLAAGRVDGSLIACQVGGLSRFTITDVLALRLMDEAAGADLATGGEEFAKRGGEVARSSRIRPPSPRMTARSMTCCSSRTLPGQSYAAHGSRIGGKSSS